MAPKKKPATSKGKTARKTAVKKTAPRKPSPKKVAKKTAKKSATKPKPRAKKKTADVVGEPVTLPKTVHLRMIDKVKALQTAYADKVDALFINTARYGGLFFVVFGGVVTLWQFQNVVAAPSSMQAQLNTSLDGTTDVCPDGGCDMNSLTDPAGVNSTTVTLPEPDVVFNFGSNEIFSDVVTFDLSIYNASNPHLMAVNRATGKEYPLSLSNSSPPRYVFRWDTTTVPDEEYRFLATVTQENIVYEFESSSVFVENAVVVEPTVSFGLTDAVELGGKIDVSITVDVSDSVRAFLKNSAGTRDYELDLVREDLSSGVYLFAYDTTLIADGDYRLVAEVSLEGVNYTEQGPLLNILNNLAETTDTAGTGTSDAGTAGADGGATTGTTDTQTATAYAPTITFAAREGDIVSKAYSTTVNVSDAEKVSLRFRNPETGRTREFSLVDHDQAAGVWKFSINTADFVDGFYRLIAVSEQGGETYTKRGPLIEINNSLLSATDLTEDPGTADDLLGTTSTGIIEPNLTTAPELKLLVDGSSPLSGTVRIRSTIDGARFVELYAVAYGSTMPQFLGLMTKQSDTEWRFAFDTEKIPNGRYQFKAVAKSSDLTLNQSTGFYIVDNKVVVEDPSAEDDVVVEEKDAEYQAVIYDVTNDSEGERVVNVDEVDEESEAFQPTLLQLVEVEYDDGTDDYDAKVATDNLQEQYKEEIDFALKALSSAYRSGDEASIAAARTTVENLRKRIVSAALEREDTAEMVERIDARLLALFSEYEQRTEKIENIVRERTNDEITTDTDGDGITDFDERTIYNTDPTVADTDGDGFLDSAEITSGFNPTDPSPEAVVRFESPKTAGVVKEDVLQVESVMSLVETTAVEDGVPTQAQIRGRALPNSYVTLYIFSTPTIVTIKTDETGSFVYTFDKELDDGEHEVYVGVTDNAGKVIAKSNPFRFVKEAQAITPIDEAASAVSYTAPTNNDLSSTSNLLVVTAIGVVAIGLVLILIGWNMDATRPKRPEIVVQS